MEKEEFDLNAELLKACEQGVLERCKELVALGADVEFCAPDRDLPIHKAICSGSMEVFDFCMERSWRTGRKNWERCLLGYAAECGSVEMVDALAKSGWLQGAGSAVSMIRPRCADSQE